MMGATKIAVLHRGEKGERDPHTFRSFRARDDFGAEFGNYEVGNLLWHRNSENLPH